MSTPTEINVRRTRLDTYPEVFSVSPLGVGATFQLIIAGLGSAAGTVDSGAGTVTFPTSGPIADGAVDTYSYKIVQTVSGLTRTIVAGKWVIQA